MSVSLAGFGDAVLPTSALDLSFDRELDGSTVSGENVWLRVRHSRIAGRVVLRNHRTIRFEPDEPLRVGERYVLTAGPGLRSTAGLPNEAREFAFGVEADAPAVRVESTEYIRDPPPLGIRIRFSGPVTGIPADRVQLIGADGSDIHPSEVWTSIDGRECVIGLPSAQRVRVVLNGLHDRWGRNLPIQSHDPVVVR